MEEKEGQVQSFWVLPGRVQDQPCGKCVHLVADSGGGGNSICYLPAGQDCEHRAALQYRAGHRSLAEALNHSDTQNVKAYLDTFPEKSIVYSEALSDEQLLQDPRALKLFERYRVALERQAKNR